MTGTDIEARKSTELPNALESFGDIAGRVAGKPLFICLDYDGTLTPIVSNPEEANLDTPTRDAVRRVASIWPAAIVSGRDLRDVRALVGLNNVYYAGSHGYEMESPSGEHFNYEDAWAYYPLLDSAETALHKELERIPGAKVERKKFALAVHYRNVPDEWLGAVGEAVGGVSRDHPALRRSGGKMIHEFRPEIDWDKGRAVRRMLEMIDSGRPGSVPIYIGDDTTDEDAFAEIQGDGIGILVRDEHPSKSAAAFALDDPDEVRRFLEQLAEVGEE